MNTKLLWLTRRAIFLALILTVQFVTKGFSPFVTGSLVNLILVTCGLTLGLSGGLTLAALSPVFAVLLGVQSPITAPLIPAIILGNMILVFITWYMTKQSLAPGFKQPKLFQTFGVILGASVKFLVIWLFALLLGPIFNLPALVLFFFSWPQLVTALIGGFLALGLYPILAKAMKTTL